MNFFTFSFLLFFAIVLTFNWLLKRWPFVWKLWLLFSSYLFYAFLDIRFLVILFAASLFNFLTGYLVNGDSDSEKGDRLMLAFAVLGNIFILALFKYYDFFRVSVESLLSRANLNVNFPLLEIVLPIGLS
ncbi:MAG TPA: hypothetical protein ENL27_02855, partial [Candidatus Parcubacteria bacterium]|nr:hypothetical protein [Candidatus Parcubacteria bacterium]